MGGCRGTRGFMGNLEHCIAIGNGYQGTFGKEWGMRKLLLCAVLLVAISATARPTCWDLGLPPGTDVNFNGDGVFDQQGVELPRGVIIRPTDGTPVGLEIGTELFGVAKISEIDAVGTGEVLFTVPAGKDMTFSFWDATVASSGVVFENSSVVVISNVYNDNAKIAIVQDDSADYSTTGGPSLFNLTTGNYPTVYDPADPGEELFLLLGLSNNQSTFTWSKTSHTLLSASFDSLDVDILGGSGASQFVDALKAHGDTFTLNLGAGDWLYNADTDIQFTSVPAPAALLSLFSGLALLGGSRLRRKS